MAEVMVSFGLSVPDRALWSDVGLLASVARDIEALEVPDRNFDILGDCFEYILGHLSTAGHFGQFRTPRHIVQFLVEAVAPCAGETVLDPACGTAGFLIAAHEYRRSNNGSYLGDECDWTMARIASANLVFHGLPAATVRRRDALMHLEREADVVLANPPFAGRVSDGRQEALGVASTKSELLFLELMLQRLKPMGRAGVVVPFSVLTSTIRPAVELRRKLVEENALRAVIELPAGVFRPYTDVRSALLLWGGAQSGRASVLMLRARADGYSLDDRREPISDNDLSSLLDCIKTDTVKALDPSCGRAVPLSQLRRTGYALNPSRFLADAEPMETRVVSLTDAIERTARATTELQGILKRIEELMR
jgi:type I restriction enzyme M protein